MSLGRVVLYFLKVDKIDVYLLAYITISIVIVDMCSDVYIIVIPIWINKWLDNDLDWY